MSQYSSGTLALQLIMTMFIVVMVTFIIIILFFIQKKQKGFTKNLLEIKANHDMELFKARLETQEQTFQDLARDLHDNVGQILTLAKLGLNALKVESNENKPDGIDDVSCTIDNAMNELRLLSRTMNSDTIKNGGLIRSIEMQVRLLERTGKLNVQFCVKGDPVQLGEMKEVILFRILQESINNIIRHSGATELDISLTYIKNFLNLTIDDNGNGFNIDELLANPHQINGLYNMQKRAKFINAEFDLKSEIGKGTHIAVMTPY